MCDTIRRSPSVFMNALGTQHIKFTKKKLGTSHIVMIEGGNWGILEANRLMWTTVLFSCMLLKGKLRIVVFILT
jgi:hypothetical protein